MSRRRRVAFVTAAVLSVAPALLLGSGASAAAGGNWWFQATGADQAQAAGWTGKGVKVAVIDSQITPSAPVFQGADLSVDSTPLCTNAGASVTTTDPNIYHGSDVTALLIGNGGGPDSVKGIAPSAEVTFYGYGIPDKSQCQYSSAGSAYAVALTAAVNGGAKIVTTSVGTSNDDARTQAAVAYALAKGVILLAATANSDDVASQAFPWSYNGVVSVNATDESQKLQLQGGAGSDADVQPDTTIVAPGVGIADALETGYTNDGSSLAAPLVAGMLADVWQKYPKATGNQLVQSLIRNATPGAGSEGYGHGVASLSKMLAVDPTQYPDVNPLMDKSSGEPSAAEVKAAGAPAKTATATASPKASASAQAAGSDSAQDTLIGVVVVVVVLVFGGIAALIIFLVRRSRRLSRSIS
jgi:hypothetical protein